MTSSRGSGHRVSRSLWERVRGAAREPRARAARRSIRPRSPREALRRAASGPRPGPACCLLALVLARRTCCAPAQRSGSRCSPQTIPSRSLHRHARVAAGRPLRSRAASGARRGPARRRHRLIVTAGRQQRSVPMAAVGDGFSYTIESVDRSFEYRVIAGGAASRAYTVTALFPPRVSDRPRLRVPGVHRADAARGRRTAATSTRPAGTRCGSSFTPTSRSRPASWPRGAAGPDAGRRRAAGVERSSSSLTTIPIGSASSIATASPRRRHRVFHPRDGRSSARTCGSSGPPATRGSPRSRRSRSRRARTTTTASRARARLRRRRPAGEDVPFTRATAPTSRASGRPPPGRRGSGRSAGRRDHLLRPARDVARGKRSDRDQERHVLPRGQAVHRGVRRGAEPGDGRRRLGAQIDSLIAAQKEIINATWNIERRSARAARPTT